ncbi:MAG: hypothetical protein ABI665_14840 [Vicinamibacterales bacterium]
MGPLTVFVVTGLVATGTWTQLDAIGWWAWGLLGLALALDYWRTTVPDGDNPFPLSLPDRTRLGAPSPGAALIGIGITLPLLLHVGLTLREEFGYGGDEGYHLSAVRAFALHFRLGGPVLLALLVTVFGVIARVHQRYLLTITVVALLVASHWFEPHTIFARYPAGFYLLAAPLNVALDVLRFPYPFAANHVVNVLSVPAWLFVLRPFYLRRWPDLAVLPAALLAYFQPMSLVYVGGGLLEPWAVVFILLAIEGIIVLPPGERWVSVLLAGAATFFKETAVLFLPTVWMLAMVDWKGVVPKLRRGGFAVGVAAATPFFFYYQVRRGFHIGREYALTGGVELWTPSRAAEWFHNVHYQLGTGGLAVIAILAAWAVAGTWRLRRDPERWRQHTAWAVTTVALVLFFYADTLSVSYTGYGRFLAYPLLALVGVLLVESHFLEVVNRRLLAGLAVGIVALQALPTGRMLALDFGPDSGRNSSEWPHALVRFPIRALAERIPVEDPGGKVASIRVISFALDLISTRVAYPDLARRYTLVLDQQNATEPKCACHDDAEAVLAGFEVPANFSRAPSSADAVSDAEAACLQQARTTCQVTVVEKGAGGWLAGVLGIGVRK